MFENPRRSRQAGNFTTNAPKILGLKSSSKQIFSPKLPLGAPESFSLQIIFFSEQPFYGNYSKLDSPTNTVIFHAFAYSSRWRWKPWQGLLSGNRNMFSLYPNYLRKWSVWWINKHKHSISIVRIFRVISFKACCKF